MVAAQRTAAESGDVWEASALSFWSSRATEAFDRCTHHALPVTTTTTNDHEINSCRMFSAPLLEMEKLFRDDDRKPRARSTRGFRFVSCCGTCRSGYLRLVPRVRGRHDVHAVPGAVRLKLHERVHTDGLGGAGVVRVVRPAP